MSDSYTLHIPNNGEKSILNVFDFDNTLFRSPIPNPKLWDSSLLGPLTAFQQINNGWWHDIRSLQLGEEVENSMWEGWWIEDVVSKVRQSMEDPQSLTVLLTGRVRDIFEDQILRMVASKGLIFDLVILKYPIHYDQVRLSGEESHSTTSFKKSIVEGIITQNPSIKHVHMWEDRPTHVLKFREAIAEMIACGRIQNGSVIQVLDPPSYMPESVEKRTVFDMVNEHNSFAEDWLKVNFNKQLPAGAQIPKKIELNTHVKYTGVFFSQDITDFILDRYLPLLTNDVDISHWTVSADHVTMCLFRCPEPMLDKSGGIGALVYVKVLAIGQYENRVWALKVGEVSMPDENTECCDNIPTNTQESCANIGHLVSNNPIPHITVVYDQTQGAKANESNLITDWRDLPPSKQHILGGTIQEKIITGIKKAPSPPPPTKAAVSLGTLIKQHYPEIKGPEIGKMVKFVQLRMSESGITNSKDNEDRITTLIVTAPAME